MVISPVPVQQAPSPQVSQTMTNNRMIVYTHMTTKNKSFLDMHYYLKSIGIKKNEFMLALLDPDLAYIDPHDPTLNPIMKHKVLIECMRNYFYFLREVVRIPSQGGAPMQFQLNRGNMAYNWLSMLNLNTFYELPRQVGKTMSVMVRYLYIYNFGTTNSHFALLHKSMDGAQDNLRTLKDLRDLLPPYLQLTERVYLDGKIDKGKDNTREIVNPNNNNTIKVFASATNKMRAASLLRGKTLTLIHYDEYGFMPYNDIVYMNAAPSIRTASENARRAGAPYGITITTTAAFMATPEGQAAYAMKENATPFNEQWYDLTWPQLQQILHANTKSNFVYVKYTYQELGYSEAWFNELCVLLKNSWPDIRREILLEWDAGVENSPFSPDDLDIIRGLVRQPISVVYLLGKYRFETYLQADIEHYPPIIGVDPAGGYKQDSSAITIIDSQTTKVLGCLNCNYISTVDLARCVEFIVRNWTPRAIISVERNGVGHGVIANLKKAGLGKNLYYEIKDVIQEERQDGVHAYKHKIRTKVFGIINSHETRKDLIDILIDRVEMHKDKIISPIIYNELLGMELKRNGRVEHSDATHDDQVFSMLMALYVWYHGTNLAERYGLRKTTIKTDEDIDEAMDFFNPETTEIIGEFNTTSKDLPPDVAQTIEGLKGEKFVDLQTFLDKRHLEEQEQFRALAATPLGERAYRNMYNIPKDVPIGPIVNGGTEGAFATIPDRVFNDFYSQTRPFQVDDGFDPQVMPAGMQQYMENDDWSYEKNFNWPYPFRQ